MCPRAESNGRVFEMLFGSKTDKIKKYTEKKNEKGLIELAKDKDKQVALAAIDALGHVGTDDGFNFLVPLLSNADADYRAAAARAMGELGNIHGRAHLSNRRKVEQDENVKKAIIEALGKIKDD